jgi:tetratricopeptide (TPR) repeat protein
VSDSPEGLFELDAEEDDDIVTRRLRRAAKARRSARQADSGAPPETAEVSGRGTGAPSEDDDDDDSDFEIDPPDDDIFARRRRPSTRRPAAKASAPAGTGRWFLLAIVVGVVAGVVLGAVLRSDDDSGAQAGTDQTAGVDLEQVMADIEALKTELAQNPDDYEAHVDLGGLLCRTGDPTGAFEHLTTAQGLLPDRQEAWLLAGMCYASQDPPDTAGAQQALTKVVELNPDSEFGRNAQNLLDGLDGGATEPADGESP